MAVDLSGRNFLKEADFTPEQWAEFLRLAAELKAAKKSGTERPTMVGKNIALIFEKTSTRTRCSFEVGAHDQGAHVTYLDPSGSQLGHKESVEDTARVLSRFCDGIMIRTFAQEEVETLAKYATIPVINGLTDFCHPCQVLADLMTIREHKGKLEGLKLCYVGDGNNMANSLIVGGLKVGMSVAIACPDTYRPDPEVLAFAEQYPGKFLCTSDILAAAKDADVLYTDVWASMGQEGEFNERMWWPLPCGTLPPPAPPRASSACGILWASSSPASCWKPPSPTPWCCTACPPTGARRSPLRSSRPTPMRSSTRPRTGCTPRRLSCTC